MPNRLALETSPYLLQHAHNPVDWYAWGEEALAKAQTDNKPILVSIGYSACHWCHVMERESFENQTVADAMNQHFVCIKIDREERPDVDALYMDALHAMGGHGGWPLNVFLLPNAKPFYGVTYLPPQNWMQLLRSIHNAFENHQDELIQSAEGFAKHLNTAEYEKYALDGSEATFSIDDLHQMFEKMKFHFDLEKGGMDRAPKFMMPSIYKFLMRYYAVSQNPEALRHIELSLNHIALGGIYDHVGGGWARYSVDAEWFIPHFEKMLYDNGQLLSVYAEAYTLFGLNNHSSDLYQHRIEQTIGWLEREMLHPEGGFYAALDADSEGVEGKFYIWTQDELQEILGDKFEAFAQLYNIKKQGNWEHGFNHLHIAPNPNGAFELPSKEVIDLLFEARKKKIRPGLDDKILTSWNGLILKGLIDAYRALGDDKIRDLAINNARFLKNKMTTASGQLWRNYKNGKANIKGFLEDYATVIEAYIALYQATFEEEWLDEALKLMAYTIENFYDADDELFFFTDRTGEQLIADKKEVFDNVVPASNSIMAHNLYALGTICGHQDYVQLADWMLSKLKNSLLADAQWATNWAALYALRSTPTAEIAIVGPEIEAFRKELDQYYLPNKLVVGTTSTSAVALLEDRIAIKGQTTIYVCYNQTCQLPVQSVAEALALVRQ
jgi:uncharacterized protein